ncbi:hypothetical protein HDV00_009801 [Rhizophlyctis rosea]|nr:hypothetical protein HDV00_009801 [Rhizophlyctis rosea]
MPDHADTQELATGYTTTSTTQFSAGEFLLSKLSLTPGLRVLDVGCGPGNLTAYISSLVRPSGHVVGIDPSKERISLAQKIARPTLQFHIGIAEDLSQFKDQSFDVVYVNSTFHWVRNQPLAIQEFARVLKPHGKLGISGGSGDFVAAHERIKAEVLSRAPYSSYPEIGGPHFAKRSEMEGLLDAAGLVDREFFVNSIVKRAKDADEMIEWLDTSSSGQTYGGIPVEMRPKAREEMKVLWEAEVKGERGIEMEMDLLVTVARKGGV